MILIALQAVSAENLIHIRNRLDRLEFSVRSKQSMLIDDEDVRFVQSDLTYGSKEITLALLRRVLDDSAVPDESRNEFVSRVENTVDEKLNRPEHVLYQQIMEIVFSMANNTSADSADRAKQYIVDITKMMDIIRNMYNYYISEQGRASDLQPSPDRSALLLSVSDFEAVENFLVLMSRKLNLPLQLIQPRPTEALIADKQRKERDILEAQRKLQELGENVAGRKQRLFTVGLRLQKAVVDFERLKQARQYLIDALRSALAQRRNELAQQQQQLQQQLQQLQQLQQPSDLTQQQQLFAEVEQLQQRLLKLEQEQRRLSVVVSQQFESDTKLIDMQRGVDELQILYGRIQSDAEVEEIAGTDDTYNTVKNQFKEVIDARR